MNQQTRSDHAPDPGAGYSPSGAPDIPSAVGDADRSPDRKSGPNTGRRQRLRRILLIAGPLAVLLVGGYIYLTGGRYVSTEDAYVQADKVAVSAEVSGPIEDVLVKENEHVAKGAPLFRIDDRPYRVALARAEASLRAAREDIAGLKASYQQKQAELRLAQSNAEFADRDYRRQEALNREKVVSQAKLDDSRRNRDVAHQQVAVVKQEIAGIVARLGGDPNAPVERQAEYLEAKAARDQAALDLERTVVRAPFAGIASNVPKPGHHVAPGAQVMSVVADTGLWVDANFKENTLTNVAPGQPVTVSVDTYPDREWHGRVESISQATGAEFAILPPQNATGNWVKVVQRIPVRIALDAAPGAPQLRAGMSAVVEIDTGRGRSPIGTIISWLADNEQAQAADRTSRP